MCSSDLKTNGRLGIGHTRWATHGGVTEPNAHPHVSGELVAVVHNGIIENHDSKRDELKAQGYVFTSQTDTEVIAHLVHRHYLQDHDLFAAVQRAVKELEGAYAIAVITKDNPDLLVVARMGCPLLIGVGEGENFVASDVSAVLSSTRRVMYLEEGDVAKITREAVQVFDGYGAVVQRELHLSDVSLASLELGPYKHFMQKEIHEQPRALSDTIEQILELPDVQERVALYREHAVKAREQLERCAIELGNLVVLDLRQEETIWATNRFMIYALFPQTNISIHVMWGLQKQNTVLATGKSILNRSSKTHVGNLMLEFGGGGHAAAGTCQVANEKADAVLKMLVERINADG